MNTDARPVYQALCRRSQDGAWWTVMVADPEGNHVRGAVSQVRRLTEVEAHVRELVSILLDVDADTFDVQLAPHLPAETMAMVEQARHLSAEAERLRREATAVTQRAVSALAGEGMTGREAAVVLGLSHQRVAQIRAT